jgi:flagellar biosynthesis chaperone FliJ
MAQKDQSRLSLLLTPLRQQEQEARQDFLRAEQGVRGLEADIRRCQAALASQDAWARQRLQTGQTQDLVLYRQCVAELGHELARKRDDLASARQKLQERRRELVQRMKQRKATEQLLRRKEFQAASDALRKEIAAQDYLHAAQMAWRARSDGDGQPAEQDHDAN